MESENPAPAPPQPARSPREALVEMRIRAPTERNSKLEALIAAVNADDQVKAWWHAAAVNASRLKMSDHSWVHIQIVLNISLRLARLLFRSGVTPNAVSDHSMRRRDAEVIIAAASLFHCVGMSVHRADHEAYSLFLTADKLGSLLDGIYEEPERSIVVAETMHAIIAHRSKGAPPFTLEAGIVRVADALDMARGRSRVPFEAGHQNIHSLSAYAIQEVRIEPGEQRPVLVQIAMSNSAGIFQVDELLATKLTGSGLEAHVEVVARVDAEHEERLIRAYRI